MSCGTTAAEAAREIEVAAIARRPCSGGDVIMKVRVCGSLIVGLLMCAVSVFAQQGTSEIRGKVADAQGAAVPGATIVVRNQDTGMFRETVSGADGTYLVSGILPGVYEITAELQGFKKLGLKDIRLEIGKTSTIDLALAVGALEEVVSVSAESPLVDVTSKEVGGNITVRLRLEFRERIGPAQQQLHAGWRQQQRRCHRPAGRHPGAHGD